MIGHMQESDIFVICSFMENSSNSLSEAQLIGMPCIASRVGGNTSLVEDGYSGLLFSPGNYIELAENIGHLLDNPHIATKLSHNARRIALRRHDPELISARMYQIYEYVHRL
jgi:glycosyltransferase involved in cell wall biosynthesis